MRSGAKVAVDFDTAYRQNFSAGRRRYNISRRGAGATTGDGDYMAKRNDFEEFVDTAFRRPLFGIICSVVLAGLGYYLTGGDPQLRAGSAWTAVFPTVRTIGQFCFIVAGLVMIISAAGYFRRGGKK
jgi:hypothetical protein